MTLTLSALQSVLSQDELLRWTQISEDYDLETMRDEGVSFVPCGHSLREKTANAYHFSISPAAPCAVCRAVPVSCVVNYGLRKTIAFVDALIKRLSIYPFQNSLSGPEVKQWKRIIKMGPDAVSLVPCGHSMSEKIALRYHCVVEASQPPATRVAKACLTCNVAPSAYVINYSLREGLQYAATLIKRIESLPALPTVAANTRKRQAAPERTVQKAVLRMAAPMANSAHKRLRVGAAK